MMSSKGLGIIRGYGGIWSEIEFSEEAKAARAKKPKKIFKYERVSKYATEDMKLNENLCYVLREDARKKYVVCEGRLYKLVNPDGELFDWMNGVDPMDERK